MRRLTINTLMTAFVAVPLMAGAAESSETPAFEDADANGDGAVSIEEAVDAGVPEEEARREDIDGDDELSEADWKFVDMSPETEGASGASGDSE